MALTKTAGWSLGTAGLCVALTAGSWFLLVEPQRAEAADLRMQTVAAQGANTELEARIAQLELDFAERPQREAELAAIRQALPDQPALAQLVREVSSAGADSGVTVDSIVTGVATAVVDPAAAVAVAPPPEDGAPAAEPSAAPSAPADAAAPVGGVTAVPGAPPGSVLAAVPVTITTTAQFGASVLFLKQLQADIERALLVEAVGMTVVPAVEAADGVEEVPEGTVATTVTARVFVFVDAESVAPPAAPPVETP
ncbi:hypothetical protein [Aquipuribacter hungaricus]|uniref:Pilus assembly protein PilO n=1 Tax=Aquipuribacter hungaricus TaxID=545624 RepID=A0ABV7WC74_9MICO